MARALLEHGGGYCESHGAAMYGRVRWGWVRSGDVRSGLVGSGLARQGFSFSKRIDNDFN